MTIVVVTHDLRVAQDAADYCAIVSEGEAILKGISELKEEARGIIIMRARMNLPHIRNSGIGEDENRREVSLTSNEYLKEKRFKIENTDGMLSFLQRNKAD